MKTGFFSFGGLETLTTKRCLDGLLTIVEVPDCPVSVPRAIASDLKRISRALALPGRAPSPVICFMPSTAEPSMVEGSVDDVAEAIEAIHSFMDLPPGVLRFWVMGPQFSLLAPAAFAQHVVFARSDATWQSHALQYPAINQILSRRADTVPTSVGAMTSADMHAYGLVDEIYDGDAEEAVCQYAMTHERRRNGIMGVNEALRIMRPAAEIDYADCASRWLSERAEAARSILF